MSLAIVNLLKLMDSGAIHLIGSLPFEANTRKEETINRVLLVNEIIVYMWAESQMASPRLGIELNNNAH